MGESTRAGKKVKCIALEPGFPGGRTCTLENAKLATSFLFSHFRIFVFPICRFSADWEFDGPTASNARAYRRQTRRFVFGYSGIRRRQFIVFDARRLRLRRVPMAAKDCLVCLAGCLAACLVQQQQQQPSASHYGVLDRFKVNTISMKIANIFSRYAYFY